MFICFLISLLLFGVVPFGIFYGPFDERLKIDYVDTTVRTGICRTALKHNYWRWENRGFELREAIRR